MREILENDTLGYYRKLPMCQCFDFSDTPITRIFSRLGDTKSYMRDPAEDAKQFYLYSHAMTKLHSEIGDYGSLGIHSRFVSEYYSFLRVQTVKMFHYLLLICIREMRHIQDTESVSKWAAQHFLGTSDPVYLAWKRCKDMGSATIAGINGYDWFGVSVHELVHALTKAFYCTGFSGGYGGSKWALISQTLDNFITGAITGEVLYDTAFSLQHNTSNIFNKPFIYNSVSDSELIRILDHQRAGQIPQLLNELGDLNANTRFRALIDAYPALNMPELEQKVDIQALKMAKPVGQTTIAKPKKEMDKPKPWNSLTPMAKSVQILPTVEVKTQ